MTNMKNNTIKIYLKPLLIVIGLLLLIAECKKNDEVPSLTTDEVWSIQHTTAKSGGKIISDGGQKIIAVGSCWSTNPTPTVADNKTSDYALESRFTSNISGLHSNTQYYIRAYAINTIGTGYGNTISFQTRLAYKPVLTTSEVININNNTAECGGVLVSDGGDSIIDCGICWSLTPSPKVDDNKTSEVVGESNFKSIITGLTKNTKYYVRAFAINSVGIGYGNEISFKTVDEPITDVDGNLYNTVLIGKQIWMRENLRTTKYNNSTSIPLVKDNDEWSFNTTGAYCWNFVWDINNSYSYRENYGYLYNCYVVNYSVNGNRNVCPTGWHVPIIKEWTILFDYLGGISVAGDKLKEKGTTHWDKPNLLATNSSGFTALPGGIRSDGFFNDVGYMGSWWSCDTDYSGTPINIEMRSGNSYVEMYNFINKNMGFSIRCIKDSI
jgi:uncharacterized protein (TIGR02145 family)